VHVFSSTRPVDAKDISMGIVECNKEKLVMQKQKVSQVAPVTLTVTYLAPVHHYPIPVNPSSS
jgi:hypothetical protein